MLHQVEDQLMEDMEKTQIVLVATISFKHLIKPSPDNIQDLYLQSLEYLGLDLSKHDIRFVEDNWEISNTWSLGTWMGSMA